MTATCKTCGAPIWFAILADTAELRPLDTEPGDTLDHDLTRTGRRRWYAGRNVYQQYPEVTQHWRNRVQQDKRFRRHHCDTSRRERYGR